MKIINRQEAKIIQTPHHSEIRPLIDRTTSAITQCSLAEEVLPPGCAVTPHRHRQLEEIYYILEGQGVMTVGDDEREVRAGDAIYIPRENRHMLANTSTEAMKILLVCGPAFFYDDEIKEAGGKQ